MNITFLSLSFHAMSDDEEDSKKTEITVRSTSDTATWLSQGTLLVDNGSSCMCLSAVSLHEVSNLSAG